MEYLDKKNTVFTVTSPKPSDFPRVKAICDERFGDGYITEEDFGAWCKDSEYCKVALYDGVVVGIVYLMPEKTESLAKALKLDEKYVNEVADGKGVIHSRCAVLDKEYEGRGIMPIIHGEIFENIKKHDFGAIFAPAWTYDGFTPMGKFLTKNGFEFIGEKENIWYDMDGYTCIVCNGKCKCKASIYQKKL